MKRVLFCTSRGRAPDSEKRKRNNMCRRIKEKELVKTTITNGQLPK